MEVVELPKEQPSEPIQEEAKDDVQGDAKDDVTEDAQEGVVRPPTAAPKDQRAGSPA